MNEKKKIGFAESASAQDKDNEEYRIKKENIKQEERNIKLGEEQIKNLDVAYDRGIQEIDLIKEEIEIKLKLYKKLGEDFINSDEWKNFVLKGLKFELQKNKDKKKSAESGFKIQKNNLISQNDTRRNIIKDLKDRLVYLKKQVELNKNDRSKMFG